ncbi:hypothetical protein [Corynebacterium pyruviciproducens]|uniref:Uncharacterized protein n=1 Tax=Corynebacterium pyruviciproducens TaxID=598660 RepID=A0AAF1BXR8_9CORY|nr:hypothetical protein [Corynebacterium pyruviciproducens]MDK6566434.1 hypothetical protein [Corynebacterium pyruviciproducens]MDK7213719.1 hypothetical protein [Corynebacterium pyruviciproducens]WOT03141.1 hypothetical protein CYJ47_05080 [Corynebacterium pyruviciproducens]
MDDDGTTGNGEPLNQRPGVVFPVAVVVVCCIILSLWLKVPGLILSVFILLCTFLLVNQDQKSTERDALIMSIRLSSEDIESTLTQYDEFLTGPSTNNLADRTLHRPELANPDSTDPDIESFHYAAANCRRFLNRLGAKTASATSSEELRRILHATDERSADIAEKWAAARRSALRIGTKSAFESRRLTDDPMAAWNKAGIDTSVTPQWRKMWGSRRADEPEADGGE